MKRMFRVALGLAVLVMVWRGAAISLHLWNYDTGVFYQRPWFRFHAIAVGWCLALTALPKAPKWLFGFSAIALMTWSFYGEQFSQPLFITCKTIPAAAPLFSVIKGGPFTRGLFHWEGYVGSEGFPVLCIFGSRS